MKTKFGSSEWIDKVTRNVLDNRASKLDPRNIRHSDKPGTEAASQCITALGYGIIAAGIATAAAVSFVTSYSEKHDKKKEAGELPDKIIDITPVSVEENESEPARAENSAGCA